MENSLIDGLLHVYIAAWIVAYNDRLNWSLVSNVVDMINIKDKRP
jgi:hypothetical protein